MSGQVKESCQRVRQLHQQLLIVLYHMPERKMWSQREDQVLRYLKEEAGQKKWSLIARRMAQEFAMPGRTGKQCRERYHNHLDAAIVSAAWTKEEEEKLYRLHDEVGNKWSAIALRLAGRSDNCVKNHFYSKLRKAVRRLNKLVSEHFRRDYREIKICSLYKILEIGESRFKTNSKYDDELVEQCLDLKNKLYMIETEMDEETELAHAETLISQLNDFQGKVKRSTRSPKPHKGSATTNYSRSQEVAVKEQAEDQEKPFYEIFRRVCQEIMLNNT